MSRKGQSDAQGTYNQASAASKTGFNNANSVYGKLFPAYEQEATNPTGFDPTTLAGMRTGAEESTGGSVAGAKGELGLRAARNRNAGSFDASVDESARSASRDNSDANLNIDKTNALLKESQHQSGLEGENALFNEENSVGLGGLGAENSATGNYVNAGNSGWFQNFLGIVNAITGAGKGASKGPMQYV